MFSIIMLYAVSATTFMISKWLVIYSEPFLLSGMRTLLAGVVFLWYVKIKYADISLKLYIIPCVMVGLFSFYISNGLKFWALQYLTSQEAALIAIIEPLFAMIFAYILCSELMTFTRSIGLLLCIVGAYIGMISYAQFPSISVPTVVLLLSVAASSYGALLMRKLVRMQHYSASVVNGISMMSAGLLSLATSFMVEHPASKISHAPVGTFILLLLIMILVSNLYAYSLYGEMLKRYSALLISSASLLRPFFVALYSGAVTVYMILSVVVIMCGLFILYRQEKDLRSYIIMKV